MSESKDQTLIQRIGYREPTDCVEPEQPVLMEYIRDGRVAIVTLNRPHADNAITNELAAGRVEVLETIATRLSGAAQSLQVRV